MSGELAFRDAILWAGYRVFSTIHSDVSALDLWENPRRWNAMSKQLGHSFTRMLACFSRRVFADL